MSIVAAGPENLFAKISRKELPCHLIGENEHWMAFLDINPLAKGHTLIIPKFNATFFHEIPDSYMSDFGGFLRKVVKTVVPPNCQYNILQNNGNDCHQFVMYVHFHIIPKHSGEHNGLQINEWSSKNYSKEELANDASNYRTKFDSVN